LTKEWEPEPEPEEVEEEWAYSRDSSARFAFQHIEQDEDDPDDLNTGAPVRTGHPGMQTKAVTKSQYISLPSSGLL
jgi:hypothetical protein